MSVKKTESNGKDEKTAFKDFWSSHLMRVEQCGLSYVIYDRMNLQRVEELLTEGVYIYMDTGYDARVADIEYLPPEPPLELEDLILADLQRLQIVDAHDLDGETYYTSENEEGWSHDVFQYSITG